MNIDELREIEMRHLRKRIQDSGVYVSEEVIRDIEVRIKPEISINAIDIIWARYPHLIGEI